MAKPRSGFWAAPAGDGPIHQARGPGSGISVSRSCGCRNDRSAAQHRLDGDVAERLDVNGRSDQSSSPAHKPRAFLCSYSAAVVTTGRLAWTGCHQSHASALARLDRDGDSFALDQAPTL